MDPNVLPSLLEAIGALTERIDHLAHVQAHPTLEQARTARLAADPWMSVDEAATYADRHPQTIRDECAQRKLEHCRLGPRGEFKIRQSALDKWLRRHTIKASRG